MLDNFGGGVIGLVFGFFFLTLPSYAAQKVIPQKVIIDTDPESTTRWPLFSPFTQRSSRSSA